MLRLHHSKDKAIVLLAHAYTYLQEQLSKPANTKYPKLKDYLTTLSEYTCNYSLLVLSEPDMLLEGTAYPNATSLLGDSLFQLSFQESFPEDFMRHMKGEIEERQYQEWVQAFYVSLLREANKVSVFREE